MNKNLSYISIINEKEKSINELKKEDIKSIKFSYNEEKKNVIYEKYNINLDEDEEKNKLSKNYYMLTPFFKKREWK